MRCVLPDSTLATARTTIAEQLQVTCGRLGHRGFGSLANWRTAALETIGRSWTGLSVGGAFHLVHIFSEHAVPIPVIGRAAFSGSPQPGPSTLRCTRFFGSDSHETRRAICFGLGSLGNECSGWRTKRTSLLHTALSCWIRGRHRARSLHVSWDCSAVTCTAL
jgi:hypothetical protein